MRKAEEKWGEGGGQRPTYMNYDIVFNIIYAFIIVKQ